MSLADTKGQYEAVLLFLVAGDFSLPARKHTRRPSQILLPAPLPVFSLVALPFPAAGGGRATSPLPPPKVARLISLLQTKRKKTPMRLFSFWLDALEKIQVTQKKCLLPIQKF